MNNAITLILGLVYSLSVSADFLYNIQEPVAINHGFTGGIDYEAESQQDTLLITTETHGSPKIGINITTLGNGRDHTSGIRSNLINNSISPDGNVAVYANAISNGLNSWQAAIHGEVRHNSGTSIAGNFEVANYANFGDLYGVVVNNVSSTSNPFHPISGESIRPAKNSVGIKVMSDGSNWNTGLLLEGGYNSGNAIDIEGNYNIAIAGKKVIGPSIPGWETPKTQKIRKALTNSSDLQETIQVLNTLIADLKKHGLITE